MAGLVTVRASIRPKKISTSGRATWVERTRSCGAWKVATLSEKEWRSAAEETLGANGSWTWTMSNGVAFSSFLTGSPVPIRSTSWPRRRSSAETRSANSLIGFSTPRRKGATWAMESGASGTVDAKHRSPPPAGSYHARPGWCSAPRRGRCSAALPRALALMYSSVCSRASSSGRWVCGDFIR